jgi:hypothetical protein
VERLKAKCPIGAIPLQLAAKKLAGRGIATGGHKIFKQLRNLGMLNGLHPSLHAEHMCWLVEKRGSWEDHGYGRVFITTSGLDEAERLLRANVAFEIPPPHVVSNIDLGVGKEVILGF